MECRFCKSNMQPFGGEYGPDKFKHMAEVMQCEECGHCVDMDLLSECPLCHKLDVLQPMRGFSVERCRECVEVTAERMRAADREFEYDRHRPYGQGL